MRLIDSHCHLNYEGLVERQDEVLENARARGVQGFLNISTRQREWNDIIGLAEREPDVWASVGVHPQKPTRIRTLARPHWPRQPTTLA